MMKTNSEYTNWPILLALLPLLVATVAIDIHQGIPPRKMALLVVLSGIATVAVGVVGYYWWPQTEDWLNAQ